MKKDVMKVFILLLSFLFVGCDNFKTKKIFEKYYIINDDESFSFSYSINQENSSFVDLVGPNIIEIGFDEKYFIVKQKDINNNEEIANYFIIPKHEKYSYYPERGIVGPLTIKEFELKIKELGIEDTLTFFIKTNSLN